MDIVKNINIGSNVVKNFLNKMTNVELENSNDDINKHINITVNIISLIIIYEF